MADPVAAFRAEEQSPGVVALLTPQVVTDRLNDKRDVIHGRPAKLGFNSLGNHLAGSERNGFSDEAAVPVHIDHPARELPVLTKIELDPPMPAALAEIEGTPVDDALPLLGRERRGPLGGHSGLPGQPGRDRRLLPGMLRPELSKCVAVPEPLPPGGLLSPARIVPRAPAVKSIAVLGGQARMTAAKALPAVRVTPVEQHGDHTLRSRLIDAGLRN